MELTREHFRLGLSRQACIDELQSLFGDDAPSYRTVKHWFNEFNRGRRLLKDELRQSNHKMVVVPENIDAVCELITQDRQLVVKMSCSCWSPLNSTIAPKKATVDWSKEMLEKYDRGITKDVNKIVTGD